MEALKSYLFTAMLASLAASVLIRISDTRHRSYIRYVAGLALLLLLVHPLIAIVQELGDDLTDIEMPAQTDTVTDGKEEFVGELGRTMSRQIGDLVSQQFGIPREAIAVKLTLDLTDLSAISIYHVDVNIRGEWDVDAIDRYLTDALHSDVTVTGVH